MASARHVSLLGGLALLLTVAAGPTSRCGAADKPTVFWQSDPIRPGETAMLYGWGLDRASAVRLGRLPDGEPGEPNTQVRLKYQVRRLPAIQASPTSVKAVLPGDLKPGLYELSVETPAGRSRPTRLNAPQIWWVQGDVREVLPGGMVRVFGRCLGPRVGAKGKGLVLLRGPKTARIEVQGTCYAVQTRLPADLPPGRYDVFVHNGHGGPMGWSRPEPIEVKPPQPWPAKVYNVRRFGARGNGHTDDTAAINELLIQVGQAGGGVVYFPRGSYRLSGTLRVPPYTILRGERRELAHLFWTNPHLSRIECVVRGRHHFGAEDLTLWFIGANNGFVADTDGDELGHVRFRRLMVRWNLYAGRVDIPKAHQIFSETARHRNTGGDGSLFWLAGPDLEVTDCDLYCGSNAIEMWNADGVRIANNKIYLGRLGRLLQWSGRKAIYENNLIVGADNMTRAGIFFSSNPFGEKIYFAGNRMHRMYAHDAEVLTSDGAAPQYFGRIAGSTATQIRLPGPVTWRRRQPIDHAAFVLAGKGKGQFRRIVAHTDSTVTVERPWDVVPDKTSVVGINQCVRQWLVVGNTFTDAISVQVYGIGSNLIFAENELERIGGARTGSMRNVAFWHGRLDDRCTEPDFFVQYLDNHVREAVRFDVRRFEMGTNAIEVYAVSPAKDWAYPFHVGHVIRTNRIQGGEIELRSRGDAAVPLIEDVVVEHNRIANAEAGIRVSASTQRVYLRGNRFERVRRPLEGDGIAQAWVHPAERSAGRITGLATTLAEHFATEGPPDVPASVARSLERLGALGAKPADDPTVTQACRTIWHQVQADLLRQYPRGHSLATLQAVMGLSVHEASKGSTLARVLAGGQGGSATLGLAADLPGDAQAVALAVRVAWPKGWKAEQAGVSADVKPGAAAPLVLNVVVPTGAWGVYALPVDLSVTCSGVTLRASTLLPVGRGEIRQWMWVGPFVNKDAPGLDTRSHAPEFGIDLNAERPGRTGPIRWQVARLPVAKLRPSQLAIGRLLHSYEGTAYGLTCLRATEPVQARLSITGVGVCEAWLNEEPLHVLSGANRRVRRLGVARWQGMVRLGAGDNFVLVKSSGTQRGWVVEAALDEVGPKAGGRVRVVPAAKLKDIPALVPPPAPKGAKLKHGRGVPWRLVHSDDFDRNDLGPDWRVAAGQWKLVGGALHGANQAFLSYVKRVAGPIRIEYDTRSRKPMDLSSFWLGAPPDFNSGYLFAVASGSRSSRIQILLTTPGRATGQHVKANRWTHVIAQVLPGRRVQLMVDDTLVLDVRGRKMLTGKRFPGLWTWGEGQFDNVKIYTASR